MKKHQFDVIVDLAIAVLFIVLLLAMVEKC
jgi:hypothetical protein